MTPERTGGGVTLPRRMRLWLAVLFVVSLSAAGCGGSKKTQTTITTPPPPLQTTVTTPAPPQNARFEKTTTAHAMGGLFAHPSLAPVPSGVVVAVTRLAKTAHVGTVLAKEGRLLLSRLGPKQHSIYAFPTTTGQVCFDITRLAEGCKRAFIVGQPASMDGADLHYPANSGPPAELAGLTKDGVTRVQVVLNGSAHDATFGHDAWYYRFPNNQTAATAASKLIVTLSNGSTKTVPILISNPRP